MGWIMTFYLGWSYYGTGPGMFSFVYLVIFLYKMYLLIYVKKKKENVLFLSPIYIFFFALAGKSWIFPRFDS